MICTRHVGPDATMPEWMGAPCPDCGHTTLGHPGITNLTLDACLICEVQAAVQQLRDTATAQALADSQELAELRARVEALEAPSMMGEGQ
jgi:hypothetical protein